MVSTLLEGAVWRKSSRSNHNGNCVEIAVVPDAAVWRKSSRSNANGDCVEVAGWRKSSRSNANGNCVEVGSDGVVVGVRDSKDPGGGVLAVGGAAWSAFLGAVKGGGYDLAR